MKKLALLMTCLFCIHGVHPINKLTFLENFKVDFRDIGDTKENELQFDEDKEEFINDHARLLTDNELIELRSIVSGLGNYEVYNGAYDPYSNVTYRKKRSLGKDLSDYLNEIVTNLEKIGESRKADLQKQYFNKAVGALDNYLTTVKNNRESAKMNALQMFKQQEYNLLLVNCGGWLWYPLKHMKKVVMCKNGSLSFQNRNKQSVQVCDDFICKNVKL